MVRRTSSVLACPARSAREGEVAGPVPPVGAPDRVAIPEIPLA